MSPCGEDPLETPSSLPTVEVQPSSGEDWGSILFLGKGQKYTLEWIKYLMQHRGAVGSAKQAPATCFELLGEGERCCSLP